MNGHRDFFEPDRMISYTAWRLAWHMAIVGTLSIATARADPYPLPDRMIRLLISGEHCYLPDLSSEAIILIPMVQTRLGEDRIKLGLPYRRTSRMHPLRLRLTGECLIELVHVSGLHTAHMSAYPRSLLMRRIQDPRLRDSWDDVPHSTSFGLCFVWPVVDALNGYLQLTDEGYKAVGPFHYPTVNFDYQLVGEKHVDLFMSVDGRFSKWFYDVERSKPIDAELATLSRSRQEGWIHVSTYDLRIDGEFMILEGGTALVAVQDKRWCVFSGFEGREPKITPIAEFDDHEPMTVVDDVDAKRSFLHFKDTLYDAEGRAVQRIAAGLASAEKVRELANAVRKHRPNERGK